MLCVVLGDLRGRTICHTLEHRKGTHQAYDSVDDACKETNQHTIGDTQLGVANLKCSARVYVYEALAGRSRRLMWNTQQQAGATLPRLNRMKNGISEKRSRRSMQRGLTKHHLDATTTHLSTFIALMNSLAFGRLAHTASASVFDRARALGRRHIAGRSSLGAACSKCSACHRRGICDFEILRRSRGAFRSSPALVALRKCVVVRSGRRSIRRL